MAQKFDIALQAKINNFVKKFNINKEKLKEDDIFEDLANYIVISNEAQKELENINSVSTNKAEGIDGIGIFVNDKLLTEENDLERIGENERIKIKICFIQATTSSRFDGKKFKAYIDKVVDFLTETFVIEPFSSIYKKLLDEEGEYIDNLIETPEVNLYFISARTNYKIEDKYIKTEKEKFKKREDLNYRISVDKIEFLQKNEINKLYDNINKFHSVQLTFSNVMQLDEEEKIPISLMSILNFKELKNIILTSNGNLREHLFVENPRSFIGYSDINKSIKETLEDNNIKQYFPYLNNGLTILCDAIEKHKTKKDTYILQYPRIINGCQTTHILYEAFKENISGIDNIKIFAKIIATEDSNELKEKIIFTTNNQNSISKDLQSLNDFLKKLEEFFIGNTNFEIYFERLRGQYSNIHPPYKKIDIENLAKVYISIFFQEPHQMKSNALKKIEKYQRNNKIFNEKDNENRYFFSAILFYWLNKKLINKDLILKSKTMDMHFLLACNLFLESNKIIEIDKKIDFVKSEDNIDSLFKKVNIFLEQQEYLFERRGFYSGPKTKKMIRAINDKPN
jgi:hypothetical protein